MELRHWAKNCVGAEFHIKPHGDQILEKAYENI